MDEQAWQSSPFFVEPLRPPSLQAKASWKTLEAELQYQAQHCHDKIQKDLGNLHAQVLNEVHAAVAQELQLVSRSFNGFQAVQLQAAQDMVKLRESIRQLQGDIQQLSQEQEVHKKEAADVLAEAVSRVVEDTSSAIQKEAEVIRETAEAQKQLFERLRQGDEAQQALGGRCEHLEKRLSEQESLHRETKELATRAMDAVPNLEAMSLDRLGELELQLQRLQQSHLQRQADSRAEVEGLEERVVSGFEGHQHLQEALKGLQEQQEQLQLRCGALEAQLLELPKAQEKAFLEMSQQDSQVAKDLRGLQARLEATEGLLSGARSNEQSLQDQLSSLEQTLEDRQRSVVRDLEQLKTDCSKEFAFAQSTWARIIDWQAQVDVATLQQHGKLDLSSPKFSAAGLENLVLHLRLQAWKERGYTCGVFLQAPKGQVSFRLHLGNKSLSFSADFSSAPEWGSQRLAVLEHLEPSMKVRLEILDVAVPLSKGYPLSLNVQAKSVDAMEVACKEATAVRSSMVKRIEWRVGRISEHVNAVRAAANSMGEEEGWQPIVSPPFAAGGFENLQLHLYPLGYRVKGEDSCGFFLVCPKGMYVKCKAFVGDMVRVWDHYYEEREPYGRGNFCRLLDKVENDDSILCGIELQEIRLEQQTQVRGGPFGSVVDEVKLIAQPSTGGMEMVRELRDHSLKAKRKVHSRSAMQQYAHLAPAIDERPGAPERIPVPLPGLGGSKSSPQLPAVGLAASPKKFEPLPISPSKLSKWR